MTLKLTNTLTRQKQVFQPVNPDRVTLYVCGPTVYNYAHIGNARPAVVFDVLCRLLRRRFGTVIYARNLTDVDDKINAAALASGQPIGVIKPAPQSCAGCWPIAFVRQTVPGRLMVVVGGREVSNRTVSVRRLGSTETGTLPLSDAIQRLTRDAAPPAVSAPATAQAA